MSAIRSSFVFLKRIGFLLPLAIMPSAKAMEPSAEKVAFFEKEVRPLLIAQCQKCHGDKKQESGLRVDSLAALLKGGTSGPAVVPGKADQGTFLAAVRHQGELKMPPSGKLRDPQIAVLTKWIADGAIWPNAKASVDTSASAKHWAFQPIANPSPPNVANARWSNSALDQFVFAAMQSKGLKPVGTADKRTMIRRMTFDLTGLPPMPEEIQAYLKDTSAEATDRVIDRLLASKSYGERWGRHWLDVARYADTAGDGADYPVREAGKYRDWVIKSLNEDIPIDQFIREQIAGDIIGKSSDPAKYADRVTATGFLAVGKRYGYAANSDYQYLDFADVIDSVGRSILGLSIGCARCHDHKYDPITAADYYALYGIFQSTKWAFPGGEELKRPTHFPPIVPPQEAARLEQNKAAQLVSLDSAISRLQREKMTLDGSAFAGGVDLGLESQPLGQPPAKAWLSSGPNSVIAEAQSPFKNVHPAGTRGVRVGSSVPTDGVRYVFTNPLRSAPGKQMHFNIDFRTVAPANQPGAYRMYLGRGVIESLAVHLSVSANEIAIGDGAKWETLRKLVPGEWYSLQISINPEKKTISGFVGKPGDVTAFKDKPINARWDGVLDTFICDGYGHKPGPAPVRDLDNLGLGEESFKPLGSPDVVIATAGTDRKPRLQQVESQLADLNKQRSAKSMEEVYPVAYGVSEGTPLNARIQKRGEPDKLGAEVPRRFLDVLGGDAVPNPATGSGRLELANWLTRASNPLTPRVFVNRVWAWHFGRGLVPTASDFGVRGDLPSHPELLDWLTRQFIDSGWSLKKLHRLILTSQTYQLAGDDESQNFAKDPENRWLWKYSRQALDAESIRDSMLAVSGKLDRSPAPQHPFPPVESWGFTIHNPFHAVYDSDRRSIYLMVQRNRRHPFLALFDAADPNISAAGRQPTTTPTQTLYLMNSPFVHAQGEAFARRIANVVGDDATRIRFAFELAHGKAVGEDEVKETVVFLTNYRKRLADREETSERQTMQSWAGFGRVLMTGNAFLYVD